MLLQDMIQVFLTFIPITISPGPANVLLSSTSARFGPQRTLSLLWGIVFVFALQIAAVGLGIKALTDRFPLLLELFQLAGACYLFYLAWLFFNASGMKASEETRLGFHNGALLQFFNMKAIIVPFILFSEFLAPAQATAIDYVVLLAELLMIIVGSLLAWVVAGGLLQRFFQSEFGVKWQGKIFGALLVGVGIWILFG